jgi:hypothetical protein
LKTLKVQLKIFSPGYKIIDMRKGMVMSISKVKGNATIIRRPDYARKDIESISEVEISNKDSRLNNNTFNDLVFLKKDQNKKDEPKQEKETKPEQKKKDDNITDFYV